MKTVKQILAENRNLVITNLTTTFKNKAVSVAVLMTDFLAFMEADEEWSAVLNNNGDDVTPFLVNAISLFNAQSSYTLNEGLIEELDEKRRETAKKYFL